MHFPFSFLFVTLVAALGKVAALDDCVPMYQSSVMGRLTGSARLGSNSSVVSSAGIVRDGDNIPVNECCKLGPIHSICGRAQSDDGVVVSAGFSASVSSSSPSSSITVRSEKLPIDINNNNNNISPMFTLSLSSRRRTQSVKEYVPSVGYITGFFVLYTFKSTAHGTVQAVFSDLKSMSMQGSVCQIKQVAVVAGLSDLFFDSGNESQCKSVCSSAGCSPFFKVCAISAGHPGEAWFAIVNGTTVYDLALLKVGSIGYSFSVATVSTCSGIGVSVFKGKVKIEADPSTNSHRVYAPSIIFSTRGSVSRITGFPIASVE